MSAIKPTKVVQIPDLEKMGEYAGEWLVYDDDAPIAGRGCQPISKEQAIELSYALDHWRTLTAEQQEEARDSIDRGLS